MANILTYNTGTNTSYENAKAEISNLKNALNYTGEVALPAPRDLKWINLIIGITSTIVILFAIGVGMYFLLKYHKKKLLEGINMTTEQGVVTTFGGATSD